MRLGIATVTIKSVAPVRLAAFWRELLGLVEVEHPTASIRLDDPRGRGPTLLIQPSESGPSAGAIHLDLRPDDHERAVARALELGATALDVGQDGSERWEVLADPDGNAFCVLYPLDDISSDLTS